MNEVQIIEELECYTCLRPIITGCICKDVAMCIKTAASDWLVKLLRCLQFSTCIFVPETKTAVRPNSCQGSMCWMECDTIHLITASSTS